MKLTTIHPDNRNLAAVTARFHKFADARGIPPEDAVIAAMLLWMGADSTTWVSPEEWAELAPELERIRARNRARDSDPGAGSSGREPEP